jgi:hypothetical protein
MAKPTTHDRDRDRDRDRAELMEITSIGRRRADRLIEMGITNRAELARAAPGQVSQALGISTEQAASLIAEAGAAGGTRRPRPSEPPANGDDDGGRLQPPGDLLEDWHHLPAFSLWFAYSGDSPRREWRAIVYFEGGAGEWQRFDGDSSWADWVRMRAGLDAAPVPSAAAPRLAEQDVPPATSAGTPSERASPAPQAASALSPPVDAQHHEGPGTAPGMTLGRFDVGQEALDATRPTDVGDGDAVIPDIATVAPGAPPPLGGTSRDGIRLLHVGVARRSGLPPSLAVVLEFRCDASLAEDLGDPHPAYVARATATNVDSGAVVHIGVAFGRLESGSSGGTVALTGPIPPCGTYRVRGSLRIDPAGWQASIAGPDLVVTSGPADDLIHADVAGPAA